MVFKMHRAGIGQNLQAPNILVIVTGQQNAGTCSFLGNPYLSTPHMDQLAKTGRVFLNAYCAQPLCTPSWMAMLTGKMPHETGITIDNNCHPDCSVMVTRLLAHSGYKTAYLGKWHLPLAQYENHMHRFFHLKHTLGDFSDIKLATAFKEFLKTTRKNPFFLVASFVNPHDISEWVKGNTGSQGPYMHPPQADECPPLPSNFLPPLGEPAVLRLVQTFAPKIYPSTDWTPDLWRQYVWAYYRLVEKADE